MMHYTLNSIDYPEANINIFSVCKIMEWNFRKWIWTMEYDANHRYNVTTKRKCNTKEYTFIV